MDFIIVSSLRQAAVFQDCPTASRSYGPRLVELRQPPLLRGVAPMPDDMEPFYNRVLSVEGNISKPAPYRGLHLRRLY